MADSYDDILYAARPVWTACPNMSPVERGAQFSPFAALTGYEKMIEGEEELLRETEGK